MNKIILSKEEEINLLTFIKNIHLTKDNIFDISSADNYTDEIIKDILESSSFKQYRFGSTKLVIIPNNEINLEYAIKIPLITENSLSEDYLSDEIFFYNQLNDNFKELFAPVYYFHTINGVKFYLQKRIRSLTDTEEKIIPSLAGQTYAEERNSGLFDPVWIGSCYDTFGEKTIDSFLAYLSDKYKERNERIMRFVDDIHEGNYGYDMVNKPVIFDYAGYEG